MSFTNIPLPTLLQDWRLMLTSWAADGSLGAAAREALRLDGEPAQLTALISQWAAGDFSGLPPIEVLEGSVLPGAAGAYAISTGTIYLNRDWLVSASEQQVIAVLTEELGHHLDEILHDQNSYGHMQVAGQHLSTDISTIAKSPKYQCYRRDAPGRSALIQARLRLSVAIVLLFRGEKLAEATEVLLTYSNPKKNFIPLLFSLQDNSCKGAAELTDASPDSKVCGMKNQLPTQPLPGLKPVDVRYEHSKGLPELLERLELSVLLTTYQAGRVVSVSSYQGLLRLEFSHFDQAMGLCRTASVIAVSTRDAIWSLPAHRKIAAYIKPGGEHGIAFLVRSCHHSGPLMGHDLAWDGERLWLVNTLLNGLVTIEGNWSFVPQWQPPFISGWAAGDRCHLNGLAKAEDGSAPAYVTALGETDTKNGWREHKATGGCLIQVSSGPVVLRGLECFTGRAFVGLSQSRETTVFGGLPLRDIQQDLLCGMAIVDLATGALRELLWFHRGLEGMFAGCVVLAALNLEMNRTGSDSERNQPSCLGPPVATE